MTGARPPSEAVSTALPDAYPEDVPSVLVVDDDPVLREVVATYLRRAGLDVLESDDGLGAVALARSEAPDVVLLDLTLPGLDGLEVFRRMRAHRGDLPIMMLTARGDESDRVLGLELGADDYLAKPFSTRELVLRVQSILRRTEHLRSTGDRGRRSDGRAARRRRPRHRPSATPGPARGLPAPAHGPRVRPPRAPRLAAGDRLLAGRADEAGLGLGVRRRVDGHRPRPPAAGEGRGRPVVAAAPVHRVGHRVPLGPAGGLVMLDAVLLAAGTAVVVGLLGAALVRLAGPDLARPGCRPHAGRRHRHRHVRHRRHRPGDVHQRARPPRRPRRPRHVPAHRGALRLVHRRSGAGGGPPVGHRGRRARAGPRGRGAPARARRLDVARPAHPAGRNPGDGRGARRRAGPRGLRLPRTHPRRDRPDVRHGGRPARAVTAAVGLPRPRPRRRSTSPTSCPTPSPPRDPSRSVEG